MTYQLDRVRNFHFGYGNLRPHFRETRSFLWVKWRVDLRPEDPVFAGTFVEELIASGDAAIAVEGGPRPRRAALLL